MTFPNSRRSQSHWATDVLFIFAGCMVMALSFRLFTNANHLVLGGVVGLSTMAQRLWGWEPAVLQWGVNVPLLVLGFIALGKGEGMKSFLGSFVAPLAVLVTRNIHPITHDTFLAALFGGIFYGVGLGLVLQGGGSVGGYSLLARMITKRIPVSTSGVILCFDVLTITAGGWLFGAESALYGIIAAFLMRRSIESVLIGFVRAYMAVVITTQGELLREKVLNDLDRGLTVLPGMGGFTGQDRSVLLVVVGQTEVPRLREVVRASDPDAFVVITSVSEVLGKGFRRKGA